MTWLLVVGAGAAVIVGWIGLAQWRRRARQPHQDVSPQWLNEHVYEKNGDRRWK